MRLRFPFRANFFLKMALLQLSLIMLPLVLGGIIAISLLRQSLGTQAQEHLQLHASMGASEVSRLVELGFTYVEAMAGNPEVAPPDKGSKPLREELEEMQQVFHLFEDITVIDPEGRVLASTTYSYRGEWGAREEFLLARQGQLALSNAQVILDPFKVVVVYAAPLRDSRGEVWGVVAGQTNMEKVWEIVKSHYPTGAGFAFLLNSQGQVVAHPRRELLFEPWPGWQRIAEQGALSGIITTPLEGSPYLVAYSTVLAWQGRPSLGWKIAVGQPQAWAYQPAASIQRTLMAGLALGGGLLLAVSLLVGQRFLSPLRALVGGMRRVAGGDLEHRLPVLTQDEVGELTAAFNTMTQELNTKIGELAESRRRIVEAQEVLRREVAERLHGPVQTRLWVLQQRLEVGRKLLASDPQAAAQLLLEIGEELESLREKEVRPISYDLHPAIIEMGLPAALRSLQDRFEGVINIELGISPEAERLEDPAQPALSPPQRLALYRCAQEALTNAIKHSRAQRVKMELTGPQDGRLTLTIEDDGMSFDPAQVKRGLGLLSMQDYIGAINGRFQLQAAPGQGTKFILSVPVAG